MIRIPLYLAVAQWALLAALGLLVVVMFRQLGRLMAGNSQSSAELGPPVGNLAAPLTYVRPGEETMLRLTPGDGQPALVAFVDPTCPSCEELVSTLDAARDAGDLTDLRTLLLISDPPGYLQISDAFRSTGLEIGRPTGPDGVDSYRVSATPLLVAIDGAGVIRAAGPVTKNAQVRAYVQACLLPAAEKTLAVVPAARDKGETST
jgi:hypothetical protein